MFLLRQMFPSLVALETYVAETKFAVQKNRMFLPKIKIIFRAADTNAAFEAYVSQCSHHESNVDEVPVLLIKMFPKHTKNGFYVTICHVV